MERKEAIDELKDAFERLLKSDDAAEKFDPEFAAMLIDVGKKLQEIQAEGEEDRNGDNVNGAPTTLDIVDPIEKVEKWRLEEVGKQNHNITTTSSCYGSLPTSPSPPTGQPAKKVSSVPTSPPAEFDSGYPGSDRSLKFYSLRGVSPAATATNSAKSKNGARFLFNLEEEDRSQNNNANDDDGESSSSSLPSDFQPSKTSSERKPQQQQQQPEPQLLKPPNLHRTYLHSVTDLSSDERSMVEEERRKAEAEAAALANAPPEATPRSLVSTGRQPTVLAEQIDQEINELRNFFDDHREEMMTLLHENSQELFPNNGGGDVGDVSQSQMQQQEQHQQPPLSSSTKRGSIRSNSFDSGTDLGDLQQERKFEFERRRRLRSRKHYQQYKSQESPQVDVAQPNFALGAYAEDPIVKQQGISALFPPVRRNSLKDATTSIESSSGNGRQVEADRGTIFVPRLNLEDVWTDEEKRDPRSFDFHQSSIVSHCQSIAEEDEGAFQESKLRDSASQTNLEALAKAASLGEISRRSEPIVVVQTCCHHRDHRSSCEVTPRSSLRRSRRTPTTAPIATTTATSMTKMRKKKKKSASKEMKALLANLEQANKMAANLRERSKEIVKLLGDEINAEDEKRSEKEEN